MTAEDSPSGLTRRRLLRSGGLMAGAAVAAACTPGEQPPPVATASPAPPAGAPSAPAAESTAGAAEVATAPAGPSLADGITPAAFDDLPQCQMTPAAAAGPFPNLDLLERRDITEGRPGWPVDLALRVVDAECTPLPGAEVEVWHTDHTGDYSTFQDGGSGKDEGQGTTFCRGVQTADADGIVVFRTIVPGWYDGRAIHIHLTCRTPDGAQLTTQLYFDEAFTDRVMTQGVYAEFGLPDTPIGRDGLAGDPPSAGTQLTTFKTGEGTAALLNLGIA